MYVKDGLDVDLARSDSENFGLSHVRLFVTCLKKTEIVTDNFWLSEKC
jgi:hypothetical protein